MLQAITIRQLTGMINVKRACAAAELFFLVFLFLLHAPQQSL